MRIDTEKVIEILQKVCEKVKEKKGQLTEMDSVTGDGDLGLNMCCGFEAVLQKIKIETRENVGEVLKSAGMEIASHSGGVLGSLYGMAFIEASKIVDDKYEIDIYDFQKMLNAAVEGVKRAGKCNKGDKTMIDAIEPAAEALEMSLKEGRAPLEALKSAVDAAYAGVETTKGFTAKKGRASYQAEKSIGQLDPGAFLSAVILDTIYNELKK
ncbi:MAG: dihydroxyacetone kinase subunit DhaL [Clostridiaceae bacterium]